MIRQELLTRCPDAPENARLGAVSFIHRFGDALNEHIHFHCCVIDAVFSLDNGALHISELPTLNQAEIAATQTRVSQRVLRWFVRRGWLDPDDARAMRDWHNDGGFSLDAAVRGGTARVSSGCCATAPVRPLPWIASRLSMTGICFTICPNPSRMGRLSCRSPRSSSSTGLPLSCHRPEYTAIAITACSRPTRRCAPKSRPSPNRPPTRRGTQPRRTRPKALIRYRVPRHVTSGPR